jgi:hypothetical protein
MGVGRGWGVEELKGRGAGDECVGRGGVWVEEGTLVVASGEVVGMGGEIVGAAHPTRVSKQANRKPGEACPRVMRITLFRLSPSIFNVLL